MPKRIGDLVCRKKRLMESWRLLLFYGCTPVPDYQLGGVGARLMATTHFKGPCENGKTIFFKFNNTCILFTNLRDKSQYEI